jgi:nitrite reductase (NO-forming)
MRPGPQDADGVNKTSQSHARADPATADEVAASGPRSDAQPPSHTVRVLDVRRARAVAGVRIVFGLVWLVDASLKWSPHFINGYLDHLAEGSAGKPDWLQPWFRFWQSLQAPAPRAAAYFVAASETLIALALLLGIARKLTYLSAAAFSLMIWAVPEGFGGPYLGLGADVDVGAGLINALVFISLLLLTADGPDPYSLDAVIERRLPWWHRLAELSSHHKATR